MAKLKCARFVGTSLVNFLDERTIEGSILRQLDEAMSFVTRNTRQAIRITGKPQHDVIPEYPEQAVREAIVNALCHRNYTEVGTIQVRIHDDRLEVWNPGHLPHDLTIKKLYHQHGSYPHNPLMANALFRARLIEQWGTGTLRIIDACKEFNIQVEFETDMGMFITRLKKLDEPSTIIPSPPKLNPRQEVALDYVRKHGRITREDMERLTGKPERTARRDLEELVETKIIRRCGKARQTWYERLS